MTRAELQREALVDLLRSAWIVESARARVYASWSPARPRIAPSVTRARERAAIVAESLTALGRAPDEALVTAHAAWITGCIDDGREAFSDLFLARLGDWVDAHAADYLVDGRERLRALGEDERSSVRFPEEVPAASPYEPLAGPRAEPPGERRLRIGVLGDLHVGDALGDAMALAAVADLNASGADVVVQLGDLTDGGNEGQFRSAAEILARLEAPCATIMGNHDVYSTEEDRLAGREYYTRFFGRSPHGLLLHQRGVRLALLDSVEHATAPFPPFDLVTGTFKEGRGGAMVRGALSVEQHAILAELAAPHSGPALVFLHHPPQPFTGFPPVVFALRDADSGRLHATCDGGNVWGVFAGHTHRNHRGPSLGGVVVQEVGVPRDFPFGIALIDVGDNGYAYNFVQISDADLLREAYRGVGEIQRRYATGARRERSFVWERL